MYPGGKNMNNLLKQAQKMQRDLAKAQEELEKTEVEVSSGGGMVTIIMDGKYKLKSINIDKDAVDPDDVEMLQDLVMAAFNEAVQKISKISEESMGKMTGGMKIPGLF
ncbi:MAG: YbaB/EbfC family nucleoid-associated protein [Candidatus Cloacimonadales bacterium]|jgi:DNA-binding YbaB/EbfC family protein|nr:YbaB/EbfC family nucleoid-associated protein [Candidatus Cloacimonadota bacterium]MDD2651167.1 YbaB/EbfC family nucleoid-associated protein [Candidatus Cloacimonadota bacterium]MDD3501781.1 YbaB/EbfC family nucleoid-associated protein [Candidatus Cloacimonadota bacterium]MDX9976563.1 YbaB/EbfC family nucleoid-associated protein [Candidatus Cloacimonadales bacterium]